MITVKVAGDRELIQRFDEMPIAFKAVLLQKTQGLAVDMQGYVVSQKLHGQVLNQRSGNLARSIQEEVTSTALSVTGRVFSAGDVKYAAIHEYGGTTPPHDIVPDKAKALAFMIGGKQVFAKVVHHPGSKMPERSFLRSTLADWKERIIQTYREAPAQAWAAE
jgi:phage gpG-like protein